MLLRSFTRHVKEQNWFAVGLDFLIVVFGVFVGLQEANWNEAKKDQETARTYINRIQVELSANVQDMEK